MVVNNVITVGLLLLYSGILAATRAKMTAQVPLKSSECVALEALYPIEQPTWQNCAKPDTWAGP